MNTGMLWYDADKTRTLAEKVKRAAEYYAGKYGAAPDCCHVHPSALNGGAAEPANGVALVASLLVQPNHFWIGVEAG